MLSMNIFISFILSEYKLSQNVEDFRTLVGFCLYRGGILPHLQDKNVNTGGVVLCVLEGVERVRSEIENVNALLQLAGFGGWYNLNTSCLR